MFWAIVNFIWSILFGSPQPTSSVHSKVWIVTGGTSGIGFQAAVSLAASGARVWITGRDESKAEWCVAKIKALTENKRVDYFVVDYEDFESIDKGVAKFTRSGNQLDGIIHNAATAVVDPNARTRQGFTRIFACNNLGPHYLQRCLDPLLLESTEGRIIWVSAQSHWLAAYDGHQLAQDPQRKSSDEESYDCSKALVLMQCLQWTKMHPESSVKSLCVNPGLTRTTLMVHQPASTRWFRSLFESSVESAASTLLAAATSEFRNNAYIGAGGYASVARWDIRHAGAQSDLYNLLNELIENVHI